MKNVLSISQKQITEEWYLVDVSNWRLGRAASIVAQILMGKMNPFVRSNLVPKTKLIVTNVSKLDVPQKRLITTFFARYSGYPGGLKFENLGDIMKQDPAKAFKIVVKGMLPKNKRSRAIFNNLYVYNQKDHPHAAQKPVFLDINNINL